MTDPRHIPGPAADPLRAAGVRADLEAAAQRWEDLGKRLMHEASLCPPERVRFASLLNHAAGQVLAAADGVRALAAERDS